MRPRLGHEEEAFEPANRRAFPPGTLWGMTSPRREGNPLEQLGAYLENVGQTNRRATRLAAAGLLGLLALVAYSLPNLSSSPLCWLGTTTGVVLSVLLWALLTKRMGVRAALGALGAWLIVQFAAGFVVPWDPEIGDAAITLGVFLGIILSFALLQLRGSFRTAAGAR